jgi:sec-independent protein translocase protein TatC
MKLFGFGSSPTSVTHPSQGDGASDPLSHPEEGLMAEMSFLDHLEDLRWSLFRGMGGIVAITIACSFFSGWIIDELLLGPAKADFFIYKLMGFEAKTLVLQNRILTGQFMVHFGVILSVGIVLGSPIFIYSIWKFIEPGLYKTEKKGLRFAAFFATFFFMLGVSFGYLIITPVAIQFFSNYEISGMISNEFDITKYFSMVTMWAFGTGVLFELPVVVYFLAKIGLATPERMRGARRYALVVAMILGAVFTPPDPFSMILVSTPLYLLYEVSILVAVRVQKTRNATIKAALANPDPS